MGVQEAYGVDPVAMAKAVLPPPGDLAPVNESDWPSTDQNVEERQRRQKAFERRLMYQDRGDAMVRVLIDKLFDDPGVKERVNRFVPLARSESIFKFFTDEIARTAYMLPPRRRIEPADAEQEKRWKAIEIELQLNARMDMAARMALACNSAFLYTRYVERLDKLMVDVITPDRVTVIPDPEDQLSAVAIIYDKPVWNAATGAYEVWRVYWDDMINFQFDATGNLTPFQAGGNPKPQEHNLGRMPFVAIHATPRSGNYWDYTTGDDLAEAQRACSLLQILSLRKLKAKGFRQLAVEGNVAGFPKGQTFDEEIIVMVPEGASLQDIGTDADAENYMALQERIKLGIAASRNVNRRRLNAEGQVDEQGLAEQRAGVLKFMAPAEVEEFEVIKLVSREKPSLALSPDLKMYPDFGNVPLRVDRKAVLEIRDIERKAGLRTVIDDIIEDNPAYSVEEAEAELEDNIETQSQWVEKIRALNMSQKADAAEPGQSPEENGRMGPKVRDKEMTADEAADQAKGGDTTEADDDADQFAEPA